MAATKKSVWVVFLAVVTLGLVLHAAPNAPKPGPSGYQLTKSIPLPGEGGWDYVAVDSDARRIYVTHGTKVLVLDADSFSVVGEIPDTLGAHGVAIASDLGRGFVSNGRANTSTIFDLKTLATLGTVKTGENPDAIAYEPVSKRVYTFNGRSKDATAFNAADGTVVAASIPLGGKPEFAAVDGKGKIFVNNEDTSELMEIDAQAAKLVHRWSLKPCESPSGLSMDVKNRRLFAGCDNKMMAVVDADTGNVITTPTIGEGVDATWFEPATGYAFSSNGEGTITVIKQDGKDKYSVFDTVPTKRSARTMGLDLKTHNIVLPAAEFLPPKEGERRGAMKPGSFVLLLVTR